jgi:hypothetical protein
MNDNTSPVFFKIAAANITRVLIGDRKSALAQLASDLQDNFKLKDYNVNVPGEYNQAFDDLYFDLLMVLNKHLK